MKDFKYIPGDSLEEVQEITLKPEFDIRYLHRSLLDREISSKKVQVTSFIQGFLG